MRVLTEAIGENINAATDGGTAGSSPRQAVTSSGSTPGSQSVGEACPPARTGSMSRAGDKVILKLPRQ